MELNEYFPDNFLYLIKHFQGQEKNWKCWLIFFLTVEVKESSSCGLLTQSIPPSTRRTEQFCFLLKLVWLLIVFQFAFRNFHSHLKLDLFYFFFPVFKGAYKSFFPTRAKAICETENGSQVYWLGWFTDWPSVI